MSPNGGNGGDTDDNPLSTYETELSALHDSIGQLVQVMLTDSVNAVKQVEIHSILLCTWHQGWVVTGSPCNMVSLIN